MTSTCAEDEETNVISPWRQPGRANPFLLLPPRRTLRDLDEHRNITNSTPFSSLKSSHSHELLKLADASLKIRFTSHQVHELSPLIKSIAWLPIGFRAATRERSRWWWCPRRQFVTDAPTPIAPLFSWWGYSHQNALSLLVSPDASDFARSFSTRTGCCDPRYFRPPCMRYHALMSPLNWLL